MAWLGKVQPIYMCHADWTIDINKFCKKIKRRNNYMAMIKNQFGVTVKRFRSDNARDYLNQTLTPFFQKAGIIHESSCVNTPQQNGVAERNN